jgi:hypothetical protein
MCQQLKRVPAGVNSRQQAVCHAITHTCVQAAAIQQSVALQSLLKPSAACVQVDDDDDDDIEEDDDQAAAQEAVKQQQQQQAAQHEKQRKSVSMFVDEEPEPPAASGAYGFGNLADIDDMLHASRPRGPSTWSVMRKKARALYRRVVARDVFRMNGRK